MIAAGLHISISIYDLYAAALEELWIEGVGAMGRVLGEGALKS